LLGSPYHFIRDVTISLRADATADFSQAQMKMRARHASKLLGMDEPTRRVLQLFIEMGADSLDLHTLFEAGGMTPHPGSEFSTSCRAWSIRAIWNHGDFYLISDKGRRAVR
jgi:hypothetical protein